MRVWKMSTILQGHMSIDCIAIASHFAGGIIGSLAFSVASEACFIVGGSSSAYLTLWSLSLTDTVGEVAALAALRSTMTGYNGDICDVAISANDQLVASCGDDNVARGGGGGVSNFIQMNGWSQRPCLDCSLLD